jgi:hypothetical protein
VSSSSKFGCVPVYSIVAGARPPVMFCPIDASIAVTDIKPEGELIGVESMVRDEKLVEIG